MNESDRTTLKKQKIAQALAAKGIPLNFSQTEAALIKFDNPRDGKDSIKHIIKNIKSKSLWPFLFQNTKTLNAMFKSEKDMNAKGKIVLYHAIPRAPYALNYINTQLCKLQLQDSLNPDYLMLRSPLHVKTLDWNGAFKKRLYAQSKGITENLRDDEIRQILLHQNSHHDHSTIKGHITSHHNGLKVELPAEFSESIAQYLISVNPSIIGNVGFSVGECSLNYWISGHSQMKIPITDDNIRVLFESKKIPNHLYEKYKDRIKDSYIHFRDYVSGPSGVMLQLSMTPRLLDETTYPSFPVGFKRTVFHKKQNNSIDSSSKILGEFVTNPFNLSLDRPGKEIEHPEKINTLQFRVIADQSKLLDYTNEEMRDNFSTKAYMLDQAGLESFQAEIDQIMKELAEDMKK